MAKALGFSKPSVSRAMGKLKAEGYLEVGEKGELVLTKEGNKIVADTSECTLISFMSNLSWARGRAYRGKGLTHGEYELNEDEKWVRVEVKDAEGLEAWSNIIQI